MPILLKKIALIAVAAGYITFFNPKGQRLACPQIMGQPKSAWKWNGKRQGIAHRWLPCGTVVYVKAGKKMVKTRVLDRGPYGALDSDGNYVVASRPFLKKWWREHTQAKGQELSEAEVEKLSQVLPPKWTWRSVADVLSSLKHKLGTRGGRQPGSVFVSAEVWEQVWALRPENDVCLPPPETNPYNDM